MLTVKQALADGAITRFKLHGQTRYSVGQAWCWFGYSGNEHFPTASEAVARYEELGRLSAEAEAAEKAEADRLALADESRPVARKVKRGSDWVAEYRLPGEGWKELPLSRFRSVLFDLENQFNAEFCWVE